MIKRAGSLTEISPLKDEISESGMNKNPYNTSAHLLKKTLIEVRMRMAFKFKQ